MTRRHGGWVIVGILFFSVLGGPVNAHHQQMVLGEATEASDLTFPQVSSGAGFFTPDSPFYFLDKAYQNFRLALARSEDKAKIRTAIAGERLAELKLMMAKDDEDGIEEALNELTDEMDKAAEDLSLAAGQGNEVSETAVEVNRTLKEHRFALKSLIQQAKGDLKLKLQAANASLKEAKVEVEDSLPEDHLLNEIQDDINETIEDEVDEASESAKGLEHAILRLDQLASQAAQRNKEKREEALRHAIEVKNDALRKQQERFLEIEKKKQERLMELQKKKEEAAREAREKLEEAQRKIEEAEREEEKIKREDEGENIGEITEKTASEDRSESNSGKE